jgi:hypothetical protein
MSKGEQMTFKSEQALANIQHPTSSTQHPTSNAAHPAIGEEGDDGWELREGEAGKRKFDLEERLLEFASAVIDLSEKLPDSRAGNHVAGQLLRCGTSPYPNHREAEEGWMLDTQC